MNNETTAQSEFVTRTALKQDHHLTDAMIELLGAPDQVKRNPYHRSTQMQLFKRGRVLAFVQANAAQIEALAAGREQRSSVSRKAADRRKAELIGRANGLQIVIFGRDLEPEHLRESAIHHYNELWSSRGNVDKSASLGDSDEFLNRITVNFLRHKASHYENWLVECIGIPGANEARTVIKSRVLDAIAAKYPWLKEECARQSPDDED